MASHGIARTARNRTEEQKLQELDKIKKYRDLEAQLRAEISHKSSSSALEAAFQLTSKLLKLNPEYYTVWNDRRRLLISGLLSRRSVGSSPSTASPTSSQTVTTTTSSGASSSSSSTTTRPGPGPQTAGRSGTTADTTGTAVGADAAAEGEKQARDDGNDGDNLTDGDKDKDLKMLKSELMFTIPLLLEFPKCYWIWNYRLWLLQQAIRRLSAPAARAIWEEELGLDSKMLTKDRRNFHAWGYRRHLISQLEGPALGGSSMVEAEFEYTTRMVHADLSNFSAWHNRSRLIPRLLEERGSDDAERRRFFDEELKLTRNALNVGPEDQSLWYYHQFLMLNLLSGSTRPSTGLSVSITPNLSREDRVSYVNREIEDIKDLLEDYNDIKWLYEALLEYTLGLCVLEQRKPDDEELGSLRSWLGKLRELDPMRNGRWKDVEEEHGLV